MPYLFLYAITNRFPIFDPVQIPMSNIDQSIPFIPLMIPIYISYAAFIIIVIYRSKNDQELTEIFYISHIQLTICLVFYIIYPVAFPREIYYSEYYITQIFIDFWNNIDGPNSCFPSMHTTNSCLAIHYSQNKKYRGIFTAWGIIIIISTLTCKHHYIVDVMAGMLVYGASIAIAKKMKIIK